MTADERHLLIVVARALLAGIAISGAERNMVAAALRRIESANT